MGFWSIKLRSFLSSINYYNELLDAYQADDWATYLYCLKCEPALVRQKMLGWNNVSPFLLALESGKGQLLEDILALGANIDETCYSTPHYKLFDDGSLHELHKRFHVISNPGYEVPLLSCLEILWALEFKTIHNQLLPKTSSQTQYRSCIWSLLVGDKERLQTFGWQILLLNEQPTIPSDVTYTPLQAAVFGLADIELFIKLWERSADSHRKQEYLACVKPHGRDDYGVTKYYGGNLLYWTEFLHLTELSAFLKSQNVPYIINELSERP